MFTSSPAHADLVGTDAPDTATAPATPAPTIKAPALRMSAIRAALPVFFAADVPHLVRALSDKGARVEALAQALAGAGLERMQSGNLPQAWAHVEQAAQSLKGATKARTAAALAHVAGLKPASLKAPDIATYEDAGYALMAHLVALLAPAPATSKPRAPATDWKAEAEAARAERDAIKAERDALAQALAEARAALAAATQRETATA